MKMLEVTEISDGTATFEFKPPIELPEGLVVRSLEHALAVHSAMQDGVPQLAGHIEKRLTDAMVEDHENPDDRRKQNYFREPHKRALLLSRALLFRPLVQVKEPEEL